MYKTMSSGAYLSKTMYQEVIYDHSNLENNLNSDYVGKKTRYVEFGPERIILPESFAKYSERIKNFEVRENDVFTMGFLKTGSRWTQEMVWLLVNNLDFEKAREVPLFLRSPLLEYETLIDDLRSEVDYNYQAANMPSPRCLRSHLQWSLLPEAITSGAKKPKIIVVLRGPEDTCTSYYHHAKVVDGYNKTLSDYSELFLKGKVPFGPYWKFVLGVWKQRNRSNIMIIKYSKMKSDLAGTVREVAAFLDKELSDDDVTKMCEHLTFDNLKKSNGFNNNHLVGSEEKVNPFVRVGQVGGYKGVMSTDLIEEFQKQRDRYFWEENLSLD